MTITSRLTKFIPMKPRFRLIPVTNDLTGRFMNMYGCMKLEEGKQIFIGISSEYRIPVFEGETTTTLKTHVVLEGRVSTMNNSADI